MEKVYVVGYFTEKKKWLPYKKGDPLPSKIHCREAVKEGTRISLIKEPIALGIDDCYYGKSACGAKKFLPNAATNQKEKKPMPQKTEVSSQTEKPKTTHAVAYTDGSYNRATGRYGYGVLLEIGNEKFEFSDGAHDNTGGWQVNGELQGALKAIKEAIDKGCTSIEIRYDYEGVRMWADGLWRTNKSYTAAYKAKIREYRKKIRVSFTHIKSHTGNTGNERADELAKKGAGIEEPVVSEDTGSGQHQVGEYVNPACRNALKVFWKKKNHSFKDFMTLKTGGIDRYSTVKTSELFEYASEHGASGLLETELAEEKNRISAIRWMMRGLSVDDAIHKVKVDTEISENAMSRRNWR